MDYYLKLYNTIPEIKRYVEAYRRGTTLTVQESLNKAIVRAVIDWKMTEGYKDEGERITMCEV